ncbi:O-antigen ligase family protein [Brevibacterium casei]|uniref:O-antigen ligase family protein n=1 Tax=Brevibacterium casei TaxID=33889 RepID=UPI00191B76E5|nr:O-antigen ligase family protein [Brevibacterium casei]QQT70245.1 O-antigen ligase family protein [Brevibacterium casei]
MMSGPIEQAQNRWSPAFSILLAAVALLPLGLTFSVGPLPLIHFVVVLAVAVAVMARIASGRAPWLWHPSAVWLLVLLVIYLMSTMAARDPAVALRTVFIATLGAALAMTVRSLCSSAQRWRILIAVLVSMGLFVSVFGFATSGSIETQSSGANALTGRAVGVFTDPNQLGTFSAVMVMIAWALALAATTWPLRLLGFLCAGLSAASLLVSFSRGAWMGAAVAAIPLIVVTFRYHLKWSLRITALLVGIGVPVAAVFAPQMWTLVTGRLLSILEPGSNPNDNRPFIYREAYRQILERPLLGQGPGNFTLESITADRVGTAVEAAHAHNLFLQVASEAGIVAAFALLAFGVGLAWRAWRMRAAVSQSDAVLGLGLICAIVAIAVQGMVDYTLGNPILYYLVWIVLGALMAITQPSQGSEHHCVNERIRL